MTVHTEYEVAPRAPACRALADDSARVDAVASSRAESCSTACRHLAIHASHHDETAAQQAATGVHDHGSTRLDGCGRRNPRKRMRPTHSDRTAVRELEGGDRSCLRATQEGEQKVAEKLKVLNTLEHDNKRLRCNVMMLRLQVLLLRQIVQQSRDGVANDLLLAGEEREAVDTSRSSPVTTCPPSPDDGSE